MTTQTTPRRLEQMAAAGQTVTLMCAHCCASGVYTKHPMHYGNTECHTCRTVHPNHIPAVAYETADDRRRRAIALLCPNASELRDSHDRRPDAHATGITERRLASDAHSVAKRRLFAILNQHAPGLTRDARLRLYSSYLRREVLSTSDMTATEIHDLATDIDCRRIAIAEAAGIE